MKKILAVALALMMLIPMALAIVPASAEAGTPSYVDMTQKFNVKTYEQNSGFALTSSTTTNIPKNASAVAGTYSTLQYAGNVDYNNKHYSLSYDVKLNETNTLGDGGNTGLMTFVYWQDWAYVSATSNNVRTFASEGKAAGAGLFMSSNGSALAFSLLTYNQAGSKYAKGVLASGSAAASLDITGLAASSSFNVSIAFDYGETMVVTVTSTADATKTATFTYDLSETNTKANLDSVTDAQPFALADYGAGTAIAVEEINNVKINGGDAISFVQGFNCKNYAAKTTGFVANAQNPLSVTKATSATKDYILQYAGSEQYDKTKYSFSYEAEYKADADASTYTFIYWDELITQNASSMRSWASEGKLNGLNLMIGYTAGTKTLAFTLIAYPENGAYAAGNKVTPSTGSAADTTLMAGITENTKLIIGWDFEYTATAKTLVLNVTRADDDTKTIELTYDLSGIAAVLDTVTNPAHPAIVNTVSAPVESIGNLVFANGEVEAGDTTLEQPDWAFNADIAVNTTDWSVYVPKLASREGFSVSDGYFTRTTNDSIDYGDAYACAQYLGGMTDNYKLQYNIKLNEDNQCRVHTYVRWNPTNYLLNQKTDGFAVTVEVDANGLVNISSIYYENQTYKGKITATPETAGNMVETEGSNILKDVIAANQQGEITVTIVAVDNKISASVALANDPTKTTGEVIFDLSTYGAALDLCVDKAGFAVLDGACEVLNNGIDTDADKTGIKPCSIGAFKLYTTETVATTVATSSTTEASTTASSTTQATTTAELTTKATTTAATTTVATTAAEEEGGCGSSITVASFAVVAAVAAGTVVVTKKRKED
ncbi:MAG: hypothetical protein IJ038_04640 [Clostridia bacterium]|nr:hypothetical protein [Clostridia bacterium]